MAAVPAMWGRESLGRPLLIPAATARTGVDTPAAATVVWAEERRRGLPWESLIAIATPLR